MQGTSRRANAISAMVDPGVADWLFSTTVPLATANDIIRLARCILVSWMLGLMLSS